MSLNFKPDCKTQWLWTVIGCEKRLYFGKKNIDFDLCGYIDQLELLYFGEIPLGSHDEDSNDAGASLLIDSHGCEISNPVWALLDYVLEKGGERPVFVGWDNDVPDWALLADEAHRAAKALAAINV